MATAGPVCMYPTAARGIGWTEEDAVCSLRPSPCIARRRDLPLFMENNTGSRPAAPASNGAQTTQASCPDHNGTLPSCAGLAVPYVPFQQDAPQKYSQSEALSNGTLFPGLNLPFHLAVDGSALPATPLAELQALEFVILELGLYLDTHKIGRAHV